MPSERLAELVRRGRRGRGREGRGEGEGKGEGEREGRGRRREREGRGREREKGKGREEVTLAEIANQKTTIEPIHPDRYLHKFTLPLSCLHQWPSDYQYPEDLVSQQHNVNTCMFTISIP